MQAGKKVFVGLSGGVDSAVAAALLKREGHDVTGLFAWIALPGYPCTAGDDRREALRVAAHLGIPFAEVDLSEQYRNSIFGEAMKAYRRGETPNPDALCNREIKFGLLYDFAFEQGAEQFATGHYARVSPDPQGAGTHLLAGADPQKDQSYFLWAVPQERLARTLFPVGGLRKSRVRTLAMKFGLPNARRKDSQGLCFLGEIPLEDALRQELQLIPGEVLDERGAVVGLHQGSALYTIGQRHGFTVRARSAHEAPHYVIAKDLDRNTITVSQRQEPPDGSKTVISLRESSWIGDFRDGLCMARYRYRQPLLRAQIIRRAEIWVELEHPQHIPIGQSLVLYRGARCLGGGIIETA